MIVEMKKIHSLALLMLLLATLLTSCNSSSFKIDGELANVKGATVRVVFRGDSGIVDESATVDKKGKFTFKGEVSSPVLVSILDQRGELLKKVVAVNGDHLKLKGDAGKSMGIKAKGSRVNEDWQLFIDEHLAFYTDPNPSRLDAAIEKYVRENPADMLSTLLLATDYSDFSDYTKVDKLFKSIEAKARPESLAAALLDIQVGPKAANLPRLMTLTLIKHGGDFEEITLTGRRTLLNLWANPQKERSSLINKLQSYCETIRVIDVLTESDTLRWHQTIADDPKAWQHYWAPGGPLEPGIQLLRIASMPWFAVTDSTGLVTYSGPNLDLAIKAAVK